MRKPYLMVAPPTRAVITAAPMIKSTPNEAYVRVTPSAIIVIGVRKLNAPH